MQRRMRATLSGRQGSLQIAIEVSAKTSDHFRQMKRQMGLREAELMALIISQVPHGHRLDENHVIWYLDMLEQLDAAQRASMAKGSRGAA